MSLSDSGREGLEDHCDRRRLQQYDDERRIYLEARAYTVQPTNKVGLLKCKEPGCGKRLGTENRSGLCSNCSNRIRMREKSRARTLAKLRAPDSK